MEKIIKIYDLKDPQQYEDEREYWKSKTPEEKLEALEHLRQQYMKLKGIDVEQGFQRVYKVIEQRKG